MNILPYKLRLQNLSNRLRKKINVGVFIFVLAYIKFPHLIIKYLTIRSYRISSNSSIKSLTNKWHILHWRAISSSLLICNSRQNQLEDESFDFGLLIIYCKFYYDCPYCMVYKCLFKNFFNFSRFVHLIFPSITNFLLFLV